MPFEQMEISPVDNVKLLKHSVLYKLNVYRQMFYSLIIYQIVGLLFISFSNGGTSMSMGNMSVELEYKNAGILFFITVLWMLVSSSQLALRQSHSLMSSVITNHKIHHYSNILILLLLSTVGAVTIILLNELNLLYVYLLGDVYIVVPSFMDLVQGFLTVFLYLLFAGSLVYFITNFVMYLNKLGYFILFFIFMACLIPSISLIVFFNYFIVTETGVLLFVIKIGVIISFLLMCSVVITRKMEVRR